MNRTPTRYFDGTAWHNLAGSVEVRADAAPTYHTEAAGQAPRREEQKNMRLSRQDVDSAFVARQLEQIRVEVMKPPVVPLKAMQLIPWMTTPIDPGAQRYTYRYYDLLGKADFIAPDANDLPATNTLTCEDGVSLYLVGDSYNYSREEILGAHLAGVPLDTRKAEAARLAIMQKLDAIARSGDAPHGLKGLFNLDSTCSYTVPADGDTSSKLWTKKDGAKILRDMHQAVQKIIDTTLEVEAPDTMCLPPAAYSLIQTTPYNQYSPDSILSVFLAASRYVTTVVPWTAAIGAGAEGVDRGVVYRRAPDALEFVGVPLEQLPTEPRNCGLTFYTAMLTKTGGVCAYKPKSVCYFDGISTAA